MNTTAIKSISLFLEVRQAGKRTFLESAKILHLEASSNYTTIHVEDHQPMMVAKVLKKYQDLLENYGFIRINNSVLINASKVREIHDDGCVVMENESTFYPSRRRKGVLKAFKL